MRRSSFSSCVLLAIAMAVCNAAAAQQSPAPAPVPMAQTAQVPEPVERQIRKTVVFIKLVCLKGNSVATVQGTGFFVAVPDDRLANGRQFKYLVTNRHMAMCWDDDRRAMEVRSLTLRINGQDGSSKELTQPGNLPWLLPSDDSVDLAAFPMALDHAVYDFLDVSEPNFATENVVKKESVSEGMKIVFSGFFYQFPGQKRMQPIVREGVLAMMPDEDLTTTTGKSGRVYLGEVHAFHGNSGSPVFVELGGMRSNGSLRLGSDYHFLGVVSGGYDEDAENNLTLETTGSTKPGNSGIALIVPAAALKAFLDDPRFVALRDAEIARQKKSQSNK